MKKPRQHPNRIAAAFLQFSIDHYSRNQAKRIQDGIDLVDLAEVAKVRRKLLKQIPR